MADSLLANKRVLITQADVFMGPALCGVFAAHGATVIASTASLVGPDAPAAVVAAAGDIDVLIANLAIPAPATPALDVTEDEWREVFATLVDPLPRLCRAVLPAMIARRAGKIVVMGSASALRGMKRASSYSAARGAQLVAVPAHGRAPVAGHDELGQGQDDVEGDQAAGDQQDRERDPCDRDEPEERAPPALEPVGRTFFGLDELLGPLEAFFVDDRF